MSVPAGFRTSARTSDTDAAGRLVRPVTESCRSRIVPVVITASKLVKREMATMPCRLVFRNRTIIRSSCRITAIRTVARQIGCELLIMSKAESRIRYPNRIGDGRRQRPAYWACCFIGLKRNSQTGPTTRTTYNVIKPRLPKIIGPPPT
jgi:hypothetical protein